MSVSEDLPVLVINLTRTPARLARFMADNAVPGLHITRFAAVDGATLDRAALVASGRVAADLIQANTVIGCSLSHIACWEHVARSGRTTLICEDDAVLRRDIAQIHHQLAQAIAGADIVFWACNLDMHVAYEAPGMGVTTQTYDAGRFASEAAIAAFQALTTVTVLYPLRRIWGASAYTVTPQGARRLLSLVLPLRNGSGDFVYPSGDGRAWHMHFESWGIDMDIGLVHVGAIKGLVAVPPVAVARHEKAASTIDAGDADRRTVKQDVLS